MSGGIQTSVSYKSPKGIPGQIADMNDSVLITAVCSGSVLPGTYVEVKLGPDGETFVCNSPKSVSGNLGAGGIACYDPMQDPYVLKGIGVTTAPAGTGFPDKMPITVMRRGAVYVLCDSTVTSGALTTAGGLDAQANVNHSSSSTPGTVNGSFTLTASVTTAGIEVTAGKGASFARVIDATSDTKNVVALLNISRPAADR